MPLTPENVGKAKELENKLQMKLNSMVESSGFNDKDPEFIRTRSNLDTLRLNLKEFDDSSTKKDASGKITQESPSYAGTNYIEGEGTPNFAYEPPVEVVKNFLRDPANINKLGLQSWAGDDQIESINEQSTAYRTVADHFWNQNVERAKAKKMPLYRYSKLSFGEDPGKVISGGLLKHIPAFFLGADETMSLGAVQKGLGAGAEAISGEPILEEQEEQKDYVSPGASLAGNISGYLTPMGVGSGIARLGSALAGSVKPLFGKALTSAAIGGIGSAVEGAGQDVVQAVSEGETPDVEQILDASGGRAAMGAIGGGVGELIGAGAKEAAESLRINNPRFQEIRDLENAGGRLSVNPFKPVKAPDVIQENLRRSLDNRGITSPVEAAAEKVAPKIADAVESQARETERAAGESLKKYYNSPQGKTEHIANEPVKFMIDYIQKGKNVGAFGHTSDSTLKAADKVRQRLVNAVDIKEIPVDQYQIMKERYGNDVIGLDQPDADFLLGRNRSTRDPGLVLHGQQMKTVIIPRKYNAEQLESLQQEIAADLSSAGGDNPWTRQIDQAFRQVRDKFDPLPGVTPTEAFLDDGTKVTGLSALQRKHHEAFQKLQEVEKSTGSSSKQAIMNKVKAFGTNKVVDENLLDEARKLGLENELFEVAGTRVTPNLRAIAGLETSRGMFTGAKDALLLRSIPMLETMGGTQRNPFIQNPNTPSGRIQKYLFEDSAKNLLNLTDARAGRFGNEVYDETNQ